MVLAAFYRRKYCCTLQSILDFEYSLCGSGTLQKLALLFLLSRIGYNYTRYTSQLYLHDRCHTLVGLAMLAAHRCVPRGTEKISMQ